MKERERKIKGEVEKMKKILTYEELQKKSWKEKYHALNCGHYLPMDNKTGKTIKFYCQHVTCPKCKKETFATAITAGPVNASDPVEWKKFLASI